MRRKRSYCLYICLTFAVCLILSCKRQKSVVVHIYEQVDELRYVNPDSAMALLNTLDVDRMEDKEKGTYMYIYTLVDNAKKESAGVRKMNLYRKKANDVDDSTALDYYRKAWGALQGDTIAPVRKSFHQIQLLLQMGRIYMRLGDYEKGMEAYRERLKLVQEWEMESEAADIATSFQGIAEIHTKQGEYDSALVYYQKALEWASLGPRSTYWVQDSHSDIYRTYLLLGDTLTANEYLKDMLAKGFHLMEPSPYMENNPVLALKGEKEIPEWVVILLVMAVCIGGGTVVFLRREKRLQPVEELLETPVSAVPLLDALQAGIRSFETSPWRERLAMADKEITPGDYMKQEDQQQLYAELDACFPSFIQSLTASCPTMNQEDIYYSILSNLGLRNRVIVYCTRTSSGTLRTRKSRLKKAMPEDTFLLVFGNKA